MVPEESVPVGAPVELSINDRGRVGLADSLGAGVLRVQGKLRGRSDSTYTLSVLRVGSMRGGTSHWSGENVVLRREYVGGVAERRLSTPRTIGVAALFTAAVVFIATRGLRGILGSDSNNRVPPDGGQQS
jgi:hypothetical protein